MNAPHALPELTVDWFGDGPLLHRPLFDDDAELPLCYAIGYTFQVGPQQAALLAARRHSLSGMVDFDSGADLIVFGSLDELREERAQRFARNGRMAHPSTGLPLLLVGFAPQVGYVPTGARLADGRPHPHAGTGFALNVMKGTPIGATGGGAHVGSDRVSRMQLIQFRIVDGRVIVDAEAHLPPDAVLDGWHVLGRGLGPALPDGEDFLVPMTAGRLDDVARAHAARLAGPGGRREHNHAHAPVGECWGSGLARWRRGPNGWQPVDYVPIVSGPDMTIEPTLVRDADGSLYMSLRGKGSNAPPGEQDVGLENTFEHFRVYRSTDNGATWQSVIHLAEQRTPTPVTVNQTADGRLYLAANPWQPLSTDSAGRKILKISMRDALHFWPLTPDRRGVEPSVCVLDTIARLGVAPPCAAHHHDNRWCIDHPIGQTVRLADGRLHHLLVCRLNDSALTSGHGPIRPQHGLWLGEVPSSAPATVSPWRF